MRFAIPFVLGSLALVGCESTVRSLPKRDGPPFGEAFAGPQALVTTDDVEGTRRTLANVVLPDTPEHHAALVATIQELDDIDAEHLLLLTEAVHGQEYANQASVTIITTGDADISFNIGGDVAVVFARGEGPYSDALDTLLIEGCARLGHAVNVSEAGRLLGRTQSAAALHVVAERVVPDVDDGSPQALKALLHEIRGDGAKRDLVVNELLPAGELEGERAHVAVDAMAFDDGRFEVVQGIVQGQGTVPFDDALRWMGTMAFDQGRREVLEACVDRVPAVGGDELVSAVEMMSFDDGRLQVVKLLAPRLTDAEFGDVLSTVEAFSFDGGRTDALGELVASETVAVTAKDLPRALSLASFDSGRVEILRLVSPRLVDGVDATTARKLLGSMSFDDGKLEAVTTLKDHLELLPTTEREALCEQMSFDSGKERARDVLGLSRG